jgi:hypothetical protein
VKQLCQLKLRSGKIQLAKPRLTLSPLFALPPFAQPLPANSTWLDRAKAINGGSFDIADVEGVKYVWRLLPYLLLTVPYWAVYNQMSTAFQNQVRIVVVIIIIIIIIIIIHHHHHHHHHHGRHHHHHHHHHHHRNNDPRPFLLTPSPPPITGLPDDAQAGVGQHAGLHAQPLRHAGHPPPHHAI